MVQREKLYYTPVEVDTKVDAVKRGEVNYEPLPIGLQSREVAVIGEDGRVFKGNATNLFMIPNIETLRNTRGKEGEIVTLAGYYEAGDKEPLNYKWTNTQGIDDGGSVINVNNGSWVAQFNKRFSILDFGGKADNIFDNSGIILKINQFLSSLNLSENNRYTFEIPLNSNFYKTSTTLIIPPNVNYISNGVLEYIGDNTKGALIIGSKDSLNVKIDLKINVRTSVNDWTNENNIGVILYNIQSTTNIDLIQSVGFAVGVRLEAINNKGFVYNNIRLGQLGNNKIDLLLMSNSNGWVNDNIFFGGRFHRVSNVNPTSNKYGVVIKSEDLSYINNNNNVFVKPSFEYNYSGTGETCPIIIEHGVQNIFQDVRMETGTVPYVIKTLNNSTDNVLDIGYQGIGYNDYYNLVKDEGEYPNTRIITRKNGTINNRKYNVYNSGYLPKKIFTKDGTHSYITDEMFIGVSTSTNNSKNSLTGLIVNTDSVNISTSRAIGVKINTQKNKRFIINRQLKINGGKGKVMVRCYDINNNILANDKPYVKGEANVIPVFSTNYGGCWRTGSDIESNFYINLNNDVAFIDVLIGGGTASCDLISFSIDALDFHTSIINPYNRIGYYATEKPTSTIYEAGTIVYNTTNSKILGWRFNGTIWVEIIELSQSMAVENISIVNATDLATAITLVNELKAKLNSKLDADRNSGQQAI